MLWLLLSVFLFDLMVVVVVWLFVYFVCFNGSVLYDFLSGVLMVLIWVLFVYVLMFYGFGLYCGLWVFVSLFDLMCILKVVVSGGIIVMIGVVMF